MSRRRGCCDDILRRLDKLDEIAPLNRLQADNDKLRRSGRPAQRARLKVRRRTRRSRRSRGAPGSRSRTHTGRRPTKRRVVVLASRALTSTPAPTLTGDFRFSGRGALFSPFRERSALQFQGEYMYFPGRQEGQFDFGLVNRCGTARRAPSAASSTSASRAIRPTGGLAQASFMLDYIFGRGRIGVFATRGFKNYAVLSRVVWRRGIFPPDFARVVNQYGVNLLFGVWGDA